MQLSEYRNSANVTLAEIAARVGVTEVSMSRYERGIRRPRPEIIAKIEAVTDGHVTANDFNQAWLSAHTEACAKDSKDAITR